MLLQYYLTLLHLFPSRVLHLSLVEQFYALLHLFFGRFLGGCTDGEVPWTMWRNDKGLKRCCFKIKFFVHVETS